MKPNVRGLMTEPEVHALARLASRVRHDEVIVEVGTHTGLSTVWMAQAAPDIALIAIDPYPDPRPGSEDDPFGYGSGDAVMAAMHDTLGAYGLAGRVIHLRARALDVAPMWTAPIGLLFEDAVHDRDSVLWDVKAFLPYITPGGVLALHDYTEDPEHPYHGVAEAAQAILATGDWHEPVVEGHLWASRRR